MAWQRSSQVVYEIVDGKAVLVDPQGIELVTLNEVGTVVWQELDGKRDATTLASDLVDRFEGVTQPQLERDIASFLAEIEAAGLASRSDGDAA